jgi:hypothetical protein
MRVIVLLLLTPILIGVFATAFRVLWVEPSGDLFEVGVLVVRFAAITYALSIGFGLPAYFLMRRVGLRAAWQVTLIGAALGGISGALLPIVFGEAYARQFFSGLYPYPVEYAMFGAVTAFAAWRLVFRAGIRRKHGTPGASD